jgi:DNA-binding IclR family transcriptional regulator
MSRSLNKALELVAHVAEGPRSLGALADASRLPKSTVHRLASVLLDHGYLRLEGGTYQLGFRLLALGEAAKQQSRVATVARPHMETLSAITGETVHLGELHGTGVVYLDKVDGGRGLQMRSRVGLISPAQTTAMGKVLVANQPEGSWGDFFRHLPAQTKNAIANATSFMSEVRSVRERGYAFDLEENEIGICCVAAPIFDARGKAIAAVSLSSAVVYLPGDRLERLGTAVVRTSQAISADLGAKLPGHEGHPSGSLLTPVKAS